MKLYIKKPNKFLEKILYKCILIIIIKLLIRTTVQHNSLFTKFLNLKFPRILFIVKIQLFITVNYI